MATAADANHGELKSNPDPEPVSKRKRKRAPSASQEASADPAESEVTDVRSDQKRKRKVWELWSKEEIGYFFEAVNEFGKDFIAVRKYFEVKKKTFTKTREQIKDFYYRTFHKLQKFVRFPKDTPRVAMELYCIINFSELWKKLGVNNIDKRLGPVLNELVQKGVVKTKMKGKFYKFRTPNCKALRKLNEKEIDSTAAVKLPEKVWIELEPLNNESSWKVQSIAHNPLLKVCVPLDKTLKSVFKFLRKRWSSSKAKLKSKLGDQLSFHCQYDDILRLAPLKDANVTIPTVREADVITSMNISFEHYQKRQKLKKEETEPNVSPEDNQIMSPGENELVLGEQIIEVPLQFDNLQPGDGFQFSFWGSDPGLDQSFVDTEAGDPCMPDHDSQDEDNHDKVKNYFEGVSSEEAIQQIRAGWAENDCGSITVGHLFTYLGEGQTIKLVYQFENLIITPEENLNIMLRALLSVGKSITERTLKSKAKIVIGQCQCGHVCPVSTFRPPPAPDPDSSFFIPMEKTPPKKLVKTQVRKNSPALDDGLNEGEKSYEDGVFKRPVIPYRKRIHKVSAEFLELRENQPLHNASLQNKTFRSSRVRKPLQKISQSLRIESSAGVSPSPLVALQSPMPIHITIGEQPSSPPIRNTATALVNTSTTPFVNFGRDLLQRMQEVTSIEIHQPVREPSPTGDSLPLMDTELSNISISELLTSPIKVPAEDLLCSASLFQTPPRQTVDELVTPNMSPLHEPVVSKHSVIKNLWGNSSDSSSIDTMNKYLLSSGNRSRSEPEKVVSDDTLNRLLGQVQSGDSSQPVSFNIADMNDFLNQLKTPVKGSGPKMETNISEDTLNSFLVQLQTPQKGDSQMNVADLNELLLHLKTPSKAKSGEGKDDSKSSIGFEGSNTDLAEILSRAIAGLKTPQKESTPPSSDNSLTFNHFDSSNQTTMKIVPEHPTEDAYVRAPSPLTLRPETPSCSGETSNSVLCFETPLKQTCADELNTPEKQLVSVDGVPKRDMNLGVNPGNSMKGSF